MTDTQSLNQEEQTQLIQAAETAICYGTEYGILWEVDPEDYPEALRENAASFVTLEIDGEIRGCIGSLEAINPLVVDVVNNAYAAGFGDPRFPPLSAAESKKVQIKVDVLNPASPIEFGTKEDLASQLQPGVDGLILKAGDRSATFLPSVWHSIKDPMNFIDALKMKAGMPQDYWSRAMTAERYTVNAIDYHDQQNDRVPQP